MIIVIKPACYRLIATKTPSNDDYNSSSDG
jgi:hypothetical protein